MTENIELVEKDKCCLKCKYYDSRTHFCRYNPPTPIVIEENEKKFITSAFSKVNCPNIDWCQKFEK